MPMKVGTPFRIPFAVAEADLIGNVDQEFIVPEDGYVTELATTVQKAITTGGTVAVKTGDALATTVAGITQTIANAATVGTRQTTKPTSGSSTRAVKKGDRLALDFTGFATAGRIAGYIGFNSADDNPVAQY